MKVTIQLSLPAEARLLAPTRQVVTAYLSQLGVSAEDRDEVVLALDEACANVVRHAYPGSGPDGNAIELVAELSPDEVLVCVEDRGRGFDIDDVEEPAPQAVRGRGLQIIHQVMTEVAVEPAESLSGTRVVMRKRLR